MKRRHIASVVLNYNSAADVEVLLPQLRAQQDVQHTVIVVDNASPAAETQRLREVFAQSYPQGVVGSPEKVSSHIRIQSGKACAYLVLNHENHGYSSGNNIALRLAETLGVDAVLIANPDMRIEDQNYLLGLSAVLFADEKNCIAASRIVGLDDKDQNPLREPGFWDEFLWPRFALGRRLGQPASYVMPVTDKEPVPVPKVSGCCMMLRLRFLQAAGWLDERVFLYCEEPILSVKVGRVQGRIMFVSALSATHAHQRGQKGHASGNMLLFIESRKYYLNHYSTYNSVQRCFLSGSYAILELAHRIKLFTTKA